MTTEFFNKQTLLAAFLPYVGCDIKHVGTGRFEPKYTNAATRNPILTPSVLADFFEDTFQITGFKLLLSPLSSISDEHAIEVAKSTELYATTDPCNDSSKKSMISEGRAIAIELSEDHLFSFTDYSNRFSTEQKLSYLSQYDPSRVIKFSDLLRSAGYDLGYGNIKSLIESGIALNKTL